MVARDRIELSTLRFSVEEKEATGGSRKPLPLFLLGFVHTRDHLNQPSAATDCHPFVTQVLHAAKFSSDYIRELLRGTQGRGSRPAAVWMRRRASDHGIVGAVPASTRSSRARISADHAASASASTSPSRL